MKDLFWNNQTVLQDQRSENRKSAILELKEVLVIYRKYFLLCKDKGYLNLFWSKFSDLPLKGSIKRQHHRREPSRRGISKNVGEAELLMVLQRRRKVMAETQDSSSSTQTCGTGGWGFLKGSLVLHRQHMEPVQLYWSKKLKVVHGH